MTGSCPGTARRVYPGFGALVASLPLSLILGVFCSRLRGAIRMEAYVGAIF